VIFILNTNGEKMKNYLQNTRESKTKRYRKSLTSIIAGACIALNALTPARAASNKPILEKYDNAGNVTKQVLDFDEDGKPDTIIWKYEYDSKGHKIYRTVYDLDGDEKPDWIWEWEHGQWGIIKETRDWNGNGKPDYICNFEGCDNLEE